MCVQFSKRSYVTTKIGKRKKAKTNIGDALLPSHLNQLMLVCRKWALKSKWIRLSLWSYMLYAFHCHLIRTALMLCSVGSPTGRKPIHLWRHREVSQRIFGSNNKAKREKMKQNCYLFILFYNIVFTLGYYFTVSDCRQPVNMSTHRTDKQTSIMIISTKFNISPKFRP